MAENVVISYSLYFIGASAMYTRAEHNAPASACEAILNLGSNKNLNNNDGWQMRNAEMKANCRINSIPFWLQG